MRASLLCRGADKAVRMRDELSRARAALESCTEAADAALRALQRSPCCAEDALRLLGDEAALDPASARAAAAAAVRRHKHVNLLRGASPVLRVVAGWLRAVEASADQRPAAGEPHTGSARRLFVAGDKRHGEPRGAQPALVAPGGGGGGLELFGELRRVELRYRPQLRAAVAASGWPAQIADRRGAVREKAADNKLCTGPDLCECAYGWSGPGCYEPLCTSCSGHGECVRPELCYCEEGKWEGKQGESATGPVSGTLAPWMALFRNPTPLSLSSLSIRVLSSETFTATHRFIASMALMPI